MDSEAARGTRTRCENLGMACSAVFGAGLAAAMIWTIRGHVIDLEQALPRPASEFGRYGSKIGTASKRDWKAALNQFTIRPEGLRSWP